MLLWQTHVDDYHCNLDQRTNRALPILRTIPRDPVCQYILWSSFFETYLHFFLIFFILFIFFCTKSTGTYKTLQTRYMSQIFCLFKNIFNSDQERADFLYTFFFFLYVARLFLTVGKKKYKFRMENSHHLYNQAKQVS